MSAPGGLLTELAGIRGKVMQARRRLPKFDPNQSTQTPEEATAAYWIERAARCLQAAESAWDEPTEQRLPGNIRTPVE